MITDLYIRYRYSILFYGLLLSLGIAPMLHPLGFGTNIIEVLLAINLIAAIFALAPGRLRRAALALFVVALVMRPASAWLDQKALSVASQMLWAVMALGTVADAIRFALRGRAVGSEQVYAALSAYLLAGLCFGVLYWVMEQLVPGSLSPAADGALRLPSVIYFSFVTLASLGYGDILPLSDPARGLAVAEVIGGQLYLAVLVARLVGAWRQTS